MNAIHAPRLPIISFARLDIGATLLAPDAALGWATGALPREHRRELS